MNGLKGRARVPGDKSISHRACILAALGAGRSEISGLSGGGDVASTLAVLGALGVPAVRTADHRLVVEGRGREALRAPAAPLDCGNSGTTLRLMLGVLAGAEGSFTLGGDASLSRRPMARVARLLASLGADVGLPEGDHPPVTVRGRRLHGADVASTVASAQVKGAVLLAAVAADGPTRFREPAPTRDHTERMLASLGVDVVRMPDGAIDVQPCPVLPAHAWNVPGDPSSAAFLCGGALLVDGSDLAVEGVCLNPGRTGFLRVLARMGADIALEDEREVSGERVGTLRARFGGLRGVTVDPDEIPDCIDELPLLAVLAACAEGETTIRGAAELRVKECDRIEAVAELLRQDGALVEVLPDGWVLGGGHRPRGGFLARCHHDHRIAMCATLLGRAAPRPIALDGADAIAVSYPTFLETLAALGGPGAESP